MLWGLGLLYFNDMRILVLTKNAGKHLSPQTFLVERLISRWSSSGHEVCVITESKRPAGSPGQTITVERSWRQLAGRLFRVVPTMARYSLPGFQFQVWIESTLDSIMNFRPNVILTFSNPYFLNVVGAKIKLRPSEIPWVAHYSDPIIDSPFKPLSFTEKKRTKFYENRVLNLADRVVFCNDNLKAETLARHSGPGNRITPSTISHSFDESQFAGTRRVRQETVLVHVGSIYGARKVNFVLESLQILQKSFEPNFNVELVGSRMLTANGSKIRQEKVRQYDWCKHIPPTSKEESIEKMRSAPLLFLLESPQGPSVFLPSKLVEYVASKRPVIIYSIPGSPSWQIGVDFGFFNADIRDRQSIIEVTESALKTFRDWQPSEAGIEKFSSKVIAREWINLFGRLS